MKTRYFHGGAPNLPIGGYILPPTQTGVPNSTTFGCGSVHDENRVYVCTSLRFARVFAVMHLSGRGIVYEVQPEGELKRDPDIEGWVRMGTRNVDFFAYSCQRAKIIAAYPILATERRRLLQMLKENFR